MIDDVVARALVPMLREGGYRKDKRTFRRDSTECVQVVNVQASRWGSRTRQQFTINLGVFFPKVEEALAGFLPSRISPAGPAAYDCQVRQRLGMLMPEQRDIWWDVEDKQDPSPVSHEVGEAMKRFGVPWLDAMSSFEAARCAVVVWAPIYALGFDLAARDTDRAQQRFRELLTGNADPAKLRAWGRRHGLFE